MRNAVGAWQYAASFDAARAQRLLAIAGFTEVVKLVADATVVDFAWERFTKPALAGCCRASFLLKVEPATYDAFFNSPSGYRGQYARSVSEGESANRRLLTSLEPILLSFASSRDSVPTSWVTTSLRATEAKVWIYESEVEAQLGAEVPAISFDPWAQATETGIGLLAPEGSSLEVKGGWLDQQCNERLNPLKANRSREIYESGYS